MKSFTDENYLLYSIPILMEKIIGVEEGDEQRLELLSKTPTLLPLLKLIKPLPHFDEARSGQASWSYLPTQSSLEL